MENLNDFCKCIRKDIVFQIGNFGVGHLGGSLSITELLVVLYKNYIRFDVKNPKKPDRDRLIVSKGHSGPAIYAILCNLGFFGREWLKTLNKPGTNLPSHCDMNKTPGIDMTTGSLGQGLSCAVGIAIAAKLCKYDSKIYAIVGDGELQEGQIWEAAMFAAHQKLDNLILFIDYNKMQIDGMVSEICNIEPLAKKWLAFGWETIEVTNGNSCSEINDAIKKANEKTSPCAVILNTIKGFGVSFARDLGIDNHSMSVSREQYEN
ncbi:MAG: transketolase [Oscillospiraceae bacterium]|nr:transketolase [Oscillospiraceae bacterium]